MPDSQMTDCQLQMDEAEIAALTEGQGRRTQSVGRLRSLHAGPDRHPFAGGQQDQGLARQSFNPNGSRTLQILSSR